MKRFLAVLCLCLAFLPVFGGFSASAAGPDVVVDFDSAEPVVIQAFLNGSPYPNLLPYVAQSSMSSAVWGLNELQDVGGWPGSVLTLGQYYNVGASSGYSVSWNQDLLYTCTYTVSLGELVAGSVYHFSVASLFSGVRNLGGELSVKVFLELYNGVNLYGDALLFELERFSASGDILMQEFSDTLSYEFEALEGYSTLKLRFEIRPIGSGATSSNVNLGFPFWIGFVGARVVAGPSAEEEFRDEQRGFWQKVLDFLTGIWDAIKAIPQAIANFFKQVWDVIKMIVDWIVAVASLLVKAISFFGVALGFLPWWMYAGAVALVAISVIYKILGRESAG